MLEKRKGIPAKKGYYTSKDGVKSRYDSMTELAMMMYFDKNNYAWKKNTSLRIPYLFEGKERKYIPDFLVETNGRNIPRMMVEIKGSNDKPELPFKCEAAEKYCFEHTMFYVLISYEQIREAVDWKEVQDYHNNNNLKK